MKFTKPFTMKTTNHYQPSLPPFGAYLTAVLLAVAGLFFTTPTSAEDFERRPDDRPVPVPVAVRLANTQFYKALNQLFTGEIKLMDEIWSHADDVTYMGPDGGYQVGWEAVRKDWAGQAAMKLGGKVEPTEIRVTVRDMRNKDKPAGNELAVVSNYEKGENTNANGEVQKVSIRATNIFRLEGRHWKMIGHHVDLLPQMAK